MTQTCVLPRFVVFEGVDGAGKTTLAAALAAYYRALAPGTPLYAGSLPGSVPGTLGEWVYRLHHDAAVDAPKRRDIAPPALQLLHVAAHVDAILRAMVPTFACGGNIVLDRYWWSTYAYSRRDLSAEQAWALVNAGRVFWNELPPPLVIYLTRRTSLKAAEIDPALHAQIDAYYREVMAAERAAGIRVHELSNDGPLSETWSRLLAVLELPYREM